MDGRRSPRRATFRTGSVIDPSGKAVTACVVREMSDTGARLELREDLELPKDFMHALADKAPRACRPCGSSLLLLQAYSRRRVADMNRQTT